MIARFFARCRALPWQTILQTSTLAIAGFLLIWTLAIAHQISTTFARYPTPQAILILDGSHQRIRKAALFAQEHPTLPILISGNCSHRPAVKVLFTLSGLSHRARYDLRATDTLTNFTTLVNDFTALGIHHVYAVTSTAHMPRSRIIATLVFGSKGIVITPIALPEVGVPPESKLKAIRDGLRAALWIATGLTTSQFNTQLGHFPGGVSCLFQYRANTAQAASPNSPVRPRSPHSSSASSSSTSPSSNPSSGD